MDPTWTFLAGLFLLILFGWYFATDIGRRKRILGSVLTVLLVAFCIQSIYPPREKIKLGIDLKGGVSFLVRLSSDTERGIDSELLDQAVEVIRKRVDSLGVSEPVIAPQGADSILVQVPEVDPDRIATTRAQLEKVARLEFKLVHPQSDSLTPQIEAGATFVPPGFELKTVTDDAGTPRERQYSLLVAKQESLSGDKVSGAFATFDQEGWGIALRFNSEGAKEFGDLTAAHVGERFAIVLDGEVQSAPQIREPIYGGNASITGRFSETEARNLASVLENPLSTPVKIEEERSASATLGRDAILSGIYAGLSGLLVSLLFVILYYRFSGLVAVTALILNIVVLFGIMAMFGFVLTLPGIAGIVLTIGMAIDANVLIYERLREELAAGKGLASAIDSAYSKAFSAIFDANATTLITAVILFWRASGPVKGFAITLTIGIIASMFCALLITRNLFEWGLAANIIKKLSMLDLIRGRGWNFLGARRLVAAVSITLVAASLAIFFVRGERNLGIDFKGGDLVMLTAARDVTLAEVRPHLEAVGHGDAVVQEEVDRTSGRELLMIRSPFGTGEEIVGQLQEAMPDAGFEVLALDKVGKLVGGELARNSAIALALGLVGILIYVTLRFEFSFALGATVALLHDVILTLGLFFATGRELSLIMVGAILTIAGYSINDTIVIFDRIREGLQSTRKGSVESIMNESINATLSRTLLTSATTLIVLAALYFFGGPVLRDFAFSIFAGILIGTYSSIFIASPVVLWWSARRGKSLDREVRETEEARERLRNVAAGS